MPIEFNIGGTPVTQPQQTVSGSQLPPTGTTPVDPTQTPSSDAVQTDNYESPTPQEYVSDTPSPNTSAAVDYGTSAVYSEEESSDPQSINVNIADADSPLVILFGPPACGKTMTLVRLTRFLSIQGFEVAPVRNFRPSYDRNYQDLCNNFNKLISSQDAAESTNKINFMLVQVLFNGKRICQILEAPGELYFNRADPGAPFPNFINTILNRRNRKIWAIMVEPDWLEPSDRRNYVLKIHRLKSRMRAYDKSIIVFNKIDKTSFVMAPGRIHSGSAIKEVTDLYPGLLQPFRNLNPITRFWRSYNCLFVPFQTGDYSVMLTGRQTFQEGPEEYPRILWNSILKMLRG